MRSNICEKPGATGRGKFKEKKLVTFCWILDVPEPWTPCIYRSEESVPQADALY